MGLAVVADEDGLLRLGDAEAISSLSGHFVSICSPHNRPYLTLGCLSYLASVHTPPLDLGQDISHTAHVDALGVGLVDGAAGVVEDVGDVLHLLGLEGEAGRGRPDAVAGCRDDGCLVEVAGADEAVVLLC